MTARKNRTTHWMFDGDTLFERIAATYHVLWRVNDLSEWERFRPIFGSGFTVVRERPEGRLIDCFIMNR